MNGKLIGDVAMVVAVLAFIVLMVWMNVAAPCETFRWATTRDLPARCLAEYSR
ncbi:MAG TPA: hypothetical protein VGW38_24415 [Chloroflexota bacterium]|nr:hypothetical protein [Chloroflexota bacterium]